MSNTLTGNTVLLFGGQKDIAPHPVIQLGIDANGLAKPMAVDSGGNLATIASVNYSATAATLLQISKTVTSAGSPEALAATTTLVESVELWARKARGTTNTGNAYIGFSATNDSQLRELAPGDKLILSAPAGKKINLAAIFIDVATSGDGVIGTAVN